MKRVHSEARYVTWFITVIETCGSSFSGATTFSTTTPNTKTLRIVKFSITALSIIGVGEIEIFALSVLLNLAEQTKKILRAVYISYRTGLIFSVQVENG